jgi:hypothetical protein
MTKNTVHEIGYQFLVERAREDFSVFARLILSEIYPKTFETTPAFSIIAWFLQAVSLGGRHRQAIAAPPRHGKSTLISELWPAFLLGINPAAEVMCASYVSEVAVKFGKGTLAAMRTKVYADIFPGTKLSSKNPAADALQTTAGGIRRAISVGGFITGMGADYLIIDDPLIATGRPSENAMEKAIDWLQSTALNRLNQPSQSVVIITQQRLSPHDLIGHAKSSQAWNIVELPAFADRKSVHAIGVGKTLVREIDDVLWPSRFPTEELGKIRAEMGDRVFEAQFQQRPVRNEGAIFDLSKFKRFHLPEKIPYQSYDAVFLSMDPAVKGEQGAAKTAFTLWGVLGARIFLVYAEMGHWGMPDQLKILKKYAPLVKLLMIEHCHSGISLAQWLIGEGINNVYLPDPDGSKEERAQDAATFVTKHEVCLPVEAEWLEMVETGLTVFPDGYADLVDSITQFLNRLLTKVHPLRVELPGFKKEDDRAVLHHRGTSYYQRNGGSFPG